MCKEIKEKQTLEKRYQALTQEIAEVRARSLLAGEAVQLVAVSKQQPKERVQALLAAGHRCFGENRIQEAQERWQGIGQDYPDLSLHLIGALQTNKVRQAVTLFDVIESLDRPKLAQVIAEEATRQGKTQRCFIQVNIGEEPQKHGVSPAELPALLTFCQSLPGIDVAGLMAIPPQQEPAALYFALMRRWQERLQLPCLSIGMSGDYPQAIRFGATHIRLGTALLGERESQPKTSA
jgi:pyridoxal phosphate enzyme (YggS family)